MRKKPNRLLKCTSPQFYFSLKRIYLLFEILLRKHFWIRLNPRFSGPRRNLENSSKTPPFCFAIEFEENGSSGCCDAHLRRLNTSRPLISFRMVQYTFEKCSETPSRSAIDCCSNIPDIKVYCTIYWRWAVNATIRRKQWLILSNRNKRT